MWVKKVGNWHIIKGEVATSEYDLHEQHAGMHTGREVLGQNSCHHVHSYCT